VFILVNKDADDYTSKRKLTGLRVRSIEKKDFRVCCNRPPVSIRRRTIQNGMDEMPEYGWETYRYSIPCHGVVDGLCLVESKV
jgi:hypothetical protein